MKLTKVDLPVSEKLKEIALMRLEAKADPTTMSQEALNTTRPLAEEVKIALPFPSFRLATSACIHAFETILPLLTAE